MTPSIDYYFAPQSPWTYLGHQRLRDIAQRTGADINVLPIDLGKIFPRSGGLPLPQRAPQRQAYRLVELKRFSDWLGLPLNLQPSYFPVPGDNAARLILAVAARDGSDAAMQLSGAVLKAVWAEQRNIYDAATLAQLLAPKAAFRRLPWPTRRATPCSSATNKPRIKPSTQACSALPAA
jgi:2-hydroxychromene-2-carboxylate isomerase